MNGQKLIVPVGGTSGTAGNRESGIRAGGQIRTVSRENILKNDFTQSKNKINEES